MAKSLGDARKIVVSNQGMRLFDVGEALPLG